MKKTKDQETSAAILPVESIAQRIFLIRGCRVMIDTDLADLYQVPTKVLNQAVKRNLERFPEDFMFQLNLEEAEASRSQSVTLKRGQNIKYLPYAFTEQGVAMLASVLRSSRAVEMSIAIVRTFVRLRELLATNKDLAFRLEHFEATLDHHASAINFLAEEIENLKALPPESAKRVIGFQSK